MDCYESAQHADNFCVFWKFKDENVNATGFKWYEPNLKTSSRTESEILGAKPRKETLSNGMCYGLCVAALWGFLFSFFAPDGGLLSDLRT